MPTPEGFILEQKPVYDWNKVPVGHVTTTQRDPKTRTTTGLTLELTPEARESLGVRELSIELPASYIFGVRRDAVTLDRSLIELRRGADTAASVLKK